MSALTELRGRLDQLPQPGGVIIPAIGEVTRRGVNDLHRAGGQRAIADYALSSAGVASPSELAGGLMRRAMDPFGQVAALADLPFIMDLDQDGAD